MADEWFPGLSDATTFVLKGSGCGYKRKHKGSLQYWDCLVT